MKLDRLTISSTSRLPQTSKSSFSAVPNSGMDFICSEIAVFASKTNDIVDGEQKDFSLQFASCDTTL
jgi:hypothetical protein